MTAPESMGILIDNRFSTANPSVNNRPITEENTPNIAPPREARIRDIHKGKRRARTSAPAI